MESFKTPTETVTLPSKGLVYPEGHPYSSGTVDIYYMTAKSEDILNSEKNIKDGTAIDKLLKSLMVDSSAFDDLIIGDKNAIMVAARVLGFGAEYKVSAGGRTISFNLDQVSNKAIDESLFADRKNRYAFKMPLSGNEVTFKILTHKDEKDINEELKGLQKLMKAEDLPRTTTQLKYMITSVNGDETTKSIREFVDKALLTRDSLALRQYVQEIQPDVDMTDEIDGQEVRIPLTLKFWYP